jgi:pimeloyl-ACP methyl ester carboxylesterase
MSGTKPTIVLSHGAWQPAAGYEPFAQKLNEAGHPTEVVALPSVGGTETPLPGVPEDIAAVRKALTKHADEGKDIILLCHSYGGLVGSNAVEGFDYASRKAAGKKGGVILTVYMSAFMVPKGKSLLDMLGGQPLPWMKVEVSAPLP